MTKFLVEKGHDAWARYATLVEAQSPEEAEKIAGDRNYAGEWVASRVAEFDDWEIMKGDTEQVADDHVLEHRTPHGFMPAEHAAVLAGLRALQDLRTMNAGELPDDINDIVTSGGVHKGISDEEIDNLCEYLNV